MWYRTKARESLDIHNSERSIQPDTPSARKPKLAFRNSDGILTISIW